MHIIFYIIMIIATPFEIYTGDYGLAFMTFTIGGSGLIGLIIDEIWDIFCFNILLPIIIGIIVINFNPFKNQFEIDQINNYNQCLESVQKETYFKGQEVSIVGFNEKLILIQLPSCPEDCHTSNFDSDYIAINSEGDKKRLKREEFQPFQPTK